MNKRISLYRETIVVYEQVLTSACGKCVVPLFL